MANARSLYFKNEVASTVAARDAAVAEEKARAYKAEAELRLRDAELRHAKGVLGEAEAREAALNVRKIELEQSLAAAAEAEKRSQQLMHEATQLIPFRRQAYDQQPVMEEPATGGGLPLGLDGWPSEAVYRAEPLPTLTSPSRSPAMVGASSPGFSPPGSTGLPSPKRRHHKPNCTSPIASRPPQRARPARPANPARAASNHGGNAHAQRQDALLEQLLQQQREGPSAARIDPGLVLR